MKEEGLEWGDKCFNVDAFQGMFSVNDQGLLYIQLLHRKRGRLHHHIHCPNLEARLPQRLTQDQRHA